MTTATVENNTAWRPIPGATFYEVSNTGAIRSLRSVDPATGQPFVMSLGLSSGYLSTRIKHDDGVTRTVFAHRAVAAAFLGRKPTPSHQALHGNDVRTDNRVENLRWGTRSENYYDSINNGTRVPRSTGKLTHRQVRAIRDRVNDGEEVPRIAKDLELPASIVRDVASGKTYRRVPQTGAEQARAELARTMREAQRAVGRCEAIERVAPAEGQRRRKAPHTPPTGAPSSRGTK